MNPGRKPDSDYYRQLRQMGVAMTIPFLLLAGPAVGLGLGLWLDSKLGTGPWLKFAGLFLGLIAGGRETALLVKRLNRELDQDDKS